MWPWIDKNKSEQSKKKSHYFESTDCNASCQEYIKDLKDIVSQISVINNSNYWQTKKYNEAAYTVKNHEGDSWWFNICLACTGSWTQ